MSLYKGKKSEDTACYILKKLNFTILDRNYLTHYGEIDIIAQKEDIIHMIEVKSTYGSYNPAENFHKTKLCRFIKTTHIYCYKNNIPLDTVQIDLLLIDRQKRTGNLIEHANLYFY